MKIGTTLRRLRNIIEGISPAGHVPGLTHDIESVRLHMVGASRLFYSRFTEQTKVTASFHPDYVVVTHLLLLSANASKETLWPDS